MGPPDVYVITGVMAAGKSTVADALARRFERAVHLHGDVFRTMIVTGRDPIDPPLSTEAERQLALRRDLACHAARRYHDADFTVVLQDVYLGDHLADVVARLATVPLHVVVLRPRPEVVAARERARAKTGYREWDVEAMCRLLDETPAVGLWLDTSDLDVDATVEAILSRPGASRVASPPATRLRGR